MVYRPAAGVSAAQIAAIRPALARYADSSLTPGWEPADLVQETVTRLLEVRDRLEIATLFAYALSTLNNLSRTGRKSAAIAMRHQHRLVTPAGGADPDEGLLRDERLDALRAALEALPPEISQLLQAHYGDMATGSTDVSGARSARLARARARLRVEYLLALRRIDLPTPRCRPVLNALSERNTRRQAEIGAGRHLLSCAACSDLADPLLARQSRLFALAPLAAAGWLRHAVKARPAVAAASGVAVAGVAAGAAVLATHSAPAAARTAAPVSQLCQLTGPGRASMAGDRITGRDVVVDAVPANEGFFVSPCDEGRVWVTLSGRHESPIRIRPGHYVTFTGTAVPLTRRTIRQQQVPRATRRALRRAGITVQVNDRAIRQQPHRAPPG
jgi:DNA-directed RNA polymerase specialized sigma24 family protein